MQVIGFQNIIGMQNSMENKFHYLNQLDWLYNLGLYETHFIALEFLDAYTYRYWNNVTNGDKIVSEDTMRFIMCFLNGQL